MYAAHIYIGQVTGRVSVPVILPPFPCAQVGTQFRVGVGHKNWSTSCTEAFIGLLYTIMIHVRSRRTETWSNATSR